MKRDKLEIARNILLICKDGAKKTEIVYKANLNFKNAEVYLKWLVPIHRKFTRFSIGFTILSP